MSNYVEMWKDLGMDLENHDNLCAVLPVAFGDVYLSQENRPEGMGFWDFVVSEIHGIRPAELVEARKNGQKVFGTFCVMCPMKWSSQPTALSPVCAAALSSGFPTAKRCCPSPPVL